MWVGRSCDSRVLGYTAANAPIADIPPWIREQAKTKADPNGNRQQRRRAQRQHPDAR